uniref:Uncharacterized protein n=1 Tax=Romanomermis culicivorax TaxID=13658 RepID=A0A915I4T2_ROMCU
MNMLLPTRQKKKSAARPAILLYNIDLLYLWIQSPNTTTPAWTFIIILAAEGTQSFQSMNQRQLNRMLNRTQFEECYCHLRNDKGTFLNRKFEPYVWWISHP